MSSIFDPLGAEGWTTLKVRHNWKTGQTVAQVRRDWETGLDFSGYRYRFHQDTLLSATGAGLDHSGTQELYRRHGCLDALAHLVELVAAGRHEGVDAWFHRQRNIRFVNNMHSSVLGVGNGRHAVRAGGVRRHDLDLAEEDVLVDGLNLSRAMSFKNAAALIPYGGCKSCVHSEPIALDDLEALGFLAWCIDRGRFMTGPDMGLSPEHADVLRTHFTHNIVGGRQGSLEPTGIPTARGVHLAIIEAVRFRMERPTLAGLVVALQGLGSVGDPLARLMLADGVQRLIVAETDADRLQAFRNSLVQGDAERVETIAPEAVLTVECDLLSLNAGGGMLGPEEIAGLRCSVVLGGANNQLRAESPEQELVLADQLAERGILYQVDWMHNIGGVVAGQEAWENQDAPDIDRAHAHIDRVCTHGVRQNLSMAQNRGITPTHNAYRTIESRIFL
jgi:leucine dehydrogenase